MEQLRVHHKAKDRGHASNEWLDTHYSFSFADFYDPKRMGFGSLIVINDDRIKGGHGFGFHSHKDTEIITIPTSGTLTHRDSMGNEGTITAGEVQVMSAGHGVVHSEVNGSEDEDVSLFQVWILPREKGGEPRYEQKKHRQGAEVVLVSPDGEGDSLRIQQDAWISLHTKNAGEKVAYTPKREGNGVYVFVVEGEVVIDGVHLMERDAYGIQAERVDISAGTDAKLLIFDVPVEMG
jgi:redox-sensitive bicupin YhaK (pirin superfamily)